MSLLPKKHGAVGINARVERFRKNQRALRDPPVVVPDEPDQAHGSKKQRQENSIHGSAKPGTSKRVEPSSQGNKYRQAKYGTLKRTAVRQERCSQPQKKHVPKGRLSHNTRERTDNQCASRCRHRATPV